VEVGVASSPFLQDDTNSDDPVMKSAKHTKPVVLGIKDFNFILV